jgi:hypothetical protein
MDYIQYTSADLHKLQDFLAGGSPVHMLLKNSNYEPELFSRLLSKLKKEWSFVYETPLLELPLTMGEPRYEGWRKWRFSIGK